MALTESQKQLLNYFKLTHVSSYENSKNIFEQIKNRVNRQNGNSKTFLEEIDIINNKLKEFDLEIVERIEEFTSEKLHILINTSPCNSILQTKFYDKNSIILFSEIIKECVTSFKGSTNETYCLNLSSQIGTSKTEIQLILENLIKEKWVVSKEGIIFLGMRTIAELEQNLKESYPDEIQNCPLCKLICIQGFTCDKCYTKYHFRCIKKYTLTSKFCSKCPNCGENLENLELPQNSEDNIT